jgi:uncharacterized membrane protein
LRDTRLAMRFLLPLLLALAFCAAPARAGLTVCNKGKHTARVALGRFDGRHWTSEGWWTVPAAKCAQLIATPLDARFYYLYGTDNAAGVWDGGKAFCTAPTAKFSIVGRAGCTRRGYDRKRFFEIDTGDNLNKVQNLE